VQRVKPNCLVAATAFVHVKTDLCYDDNTITYYYGILSKNSKSETKKQVPSEEMPTGGMHYVESFITM